MAPDDVMAIVPDVALTLVSAVIECSTAPLLLLDGDFRVILASRSFGLAFNQPLSAVVGQAIFAIGNGEWNVPELRSLLMATGSGTATIPAFEIDLALPGEDCRRLVINASKLVYHGSEQSTRILLAIADVTAARLAARLNEALLREKAVLMREIQHRVSNSLQIIASVLMQSARKVGSEEARVHLRDAHGRVMAIAELQRQLAESDRSEVQIGAYLQQLCHSLGASMIEDHDRVTLVATADNSLVKANVSVSIGLVVTELVINALKHAFPMLRQGNVQVDFRGDGSAWTLQVSDDGIGMAGEADTSAGLGTSIVTALARHLNAEITVSDNAPGTLVSVVHSTGPALNVDDGAV